MTTPDNPTAAVVPDDPREAEQLEYIAHLVHLERDGEATPILMGPYTLITMIGLIQLAMRAPDHSPVMVNLAHQLVDSLAIPFAGTMGAEIVAQGWNPDMDMVPVSPARDGFAAWLAAEYPATAGDSFAEYREADMAAAFEAGRLYAAGRPRMTP